MDEFELPETLTDLSDEDIGALEAQAVEAFDAVSADLASPDALENLGKLADAIDLLRAEAGRRFEEAAVAVEAAEALAARVHGEPEATSTEPDSEGDEDPPGTEEDTDDDGSDAGEGGAAAPDVEVVVNNEDEQVPVTASAPRRGRISVPLGNIRRHAPDPQVDSPSGVSIIAASDLPGVTSGSRMDGLDAIGPALHGRARSLIEGGSGLVASIELPQRPGTHISQNATQEQMTAALDAAANPASLTAAGGWCAPSQVLYDQFSIEAADGLIDIPTVTIDRAGIEVAVSPSIAAVFNHGFEWTEAQDIAALGNPHVDPEDDEVKPCFRIPCPTWTETRLGAFGVCLTHGNLSDRAYPENTRRFVDLVMAAHAHVGSIRTITKLLALQDAVTIAAVANSGATASLLAAVELQVLDYRSKFRMSDSSTLEAVFPTWIKGVMRADISRRLGTAEFSVTDAQIDAWFSMRGVRAQYVSDWQILSNTGPTGTAGDGFVEIWPPTVVWMLYAAGTYVRGTGGTLDLGVARDQSQNATNDHTVVFTEEFDLVAKRGHEGRKITTTVCPNGSTSSGGAIICAIA